MEDEHRDRQIQFSLYIPQPLLFNALFNIEVQMAVIISQQTGDPVGSQHFIKLPFSPVSTTFVFLFYTCSPTNVWGPFSSQTSEPMFWAFQEPLLFSLFCWI